MNVPRLIGAVGLLAAAGLAICVALEMRACQKLSAANAELQRRLHDGQEILVENSRLTNRLVQVRLIAGTNGVADPRIEEIARLRQELESFQQVSNEIATLRADADATAAALKSLRQAQIASRVAARRNSTGGTSTQLDILSAQFGNAEASVDVTDEIVDRVRGDTLKTIAGRNLLGKPDTETPKRLTIVFRYGGALFTNSVPDGQPVILPVPSEMMQD